MHGFASVTAAFLDCYMVLLRNFWNCLFLYFFHIKYKMLPQGLWKLKENNWRKYNQISRKISKFQLSYIHISTIPARSFYNDAAFCSFEFLFLNKKYFRNQTWVSIICWNNAIFSKNSIFLVQSPTLSLFKSVHK